MTTNCDLVDAVFILPGSDDVTIPHFQTLKRVVMLLLRGMSIDESETRLGVVTYGSKLGTAIPLSGNRMLMGKSLMKLQKIGGSSKPMIGLEKAKNLLTSNKRYAVPQVAVLLYKNVTKEVQAETREVAEEMSEQNIRVISIGIGSDDFADLAWTKEQAYRFDTIETLFSTIRQIPQYICKAILASKPQSKTPIPKPATESTDSQEQQESPDNEEDSSICDTATWVYDVGYAPVSGDIGRFAMCYKGLGKTLKVSYKSCPFGQYWSALDVTCIQFSRLNLPYETNTICQLKAVPGLPNKFQQKTLEGIWKVFKCAEGAVFSEEDCGCTRFSVTQYRAKQTEDSCSPELYLPFCDGIKDFSGKETYVESHGQVWIRDGKAYFDGKSSLFIPRFASVEYGNTVVIKLKYLADEEDEGYESEGDPTDDDDDKNEYALISNGNCYGSSCEHPSISISSRGSTTLFNVNSVYDNVTIMSGHSRRKRDLGENNSTNSDGDDDDDDDDVENTLEFKAEASEIDDDVSSLDVDDKIQPELNANRNDTAATTYQGTYENDDNENNENENMMNVDENKIDRKNDLTNTTYKNVASTIENTDSNVIPLHTDNAKGTENFNFDLIFTNGETDGITRIIDDIKGVIVNNNDQMDQNDDTAEESVSNIAQETHDTVLINALEPEDMSSNNTPNPDDVSSNNAPEPDDITNLLEPDNISSNNAFESDDRAANNVPELDDVLSNNPSQPDDALPNNIPRPEDVLSSNALEKDDKVSDNFVEPDNELSNSSLELEDVLSTEILEIDDRSSIASSEPDDALPTLSNNAQIPEDNLTRTSTVKSTVTNILTDDEVSENGAESREDIKTEEISERDKELNESAEAPDEVMNENTSHFAEVNDLTPVITIGGDNLDDIKKKTLVNITFLDIATDNISKEDSESVSNMSKKTDTMITKEVSNVNEGNLERGIISGDFITHSLTNENTPSAKTTEMEDSKKNKDMEGQKKKNEIVNNKKKEGKAIFSEENKDGTEKISEEKLRKWKTVSLKIKDGVIQVTIDGRKEDDKYLRGYVQTTNSGIHIGSGTGRRNFKGYMDEIYIYLCDPDNNSAKERRRQLLYDRRSRLLADKEKTSKLSANCDYINPKAHDWLRDRR
ncbi:protein PIF-like [Saccostrea echinata]|uniref:protein PIF-like n=1 Tax=Saccostrea echinata TaxID=191078 RepID=UPI002A821D3C|nr:protein PIF-like [Saccostrea echinata]